MTKISETYNPFAAIVAYKSNVDESYYMEYRKIHDGCMGAGVPLREKDLARLLKNVRDTTEQLPLGLHGALPGNVLYCSTDVDHVRLVWYRPKEKRSVFFVDGLGIPNGELRVPGLVYSVNGGTLSVFAYKGAKPKSVLYRAPFMNVYGDCHICLGNAKVRKPEDNTFVKTMDYWEQMFWRSEFSHILDANPIDGNLAVITKDCIINGKPFPESVMLKVDRKLNDLLK